MFGVRPVIQVLARGQATYADARSLPSEETLLQDALDRGDLKPLTPSDIVVHHNYGYGAVVKVEDTGEDPK
jgi:hypothetical protein